MNISQTAQRILQKRASAQQQPQSYLLAPMRQYINPMIPQSGTSYDPNFARGIRNQDFQYLPMPQTIEQQGANQANSDQAGPIQSLLNRIPANIKIAMQNNSGQSGPAQSLLKNRIPARLIAMPESGQVNPSMYGRIPIINRFQPQQQLPIGERYMGRFQPTNYLGGQ